MFLKKIAFLMIVTTIASSLVSCGYSRWYYAPTERNVGKSDIWSLDFGFTDYESTLPVSIGQSYPDTSFFYIIEFKEKDTTENARLSFRVDDVHLSHSKEMERIVLKKHAEVSERDLHNGATSVNRTVYFGPFSISKPRPDTIVIDQKVTIFVQYSGEEVTSFHLTVKAVLSEERRSSFRDFIRGT